MNTKLRHQKAAFGPRATALGCTMKTLPKTMVAGVVSLTCCVAPLWAVDSDGDGLSDEVEVQITGTDPFDWDTDDDGLGDLELPRGIVYYRDKWFNGNTHG